MPIFKQKTAGAATAASSSTAKPNKSFITLDTKHQGFLKEFNNNDTVVIPQLKQTLRDLKQQLAVAEQNAASIDERLEIQDSIDDVKTQIKGLNAKKTKYLNDNARLVFNYFENKKSIETSQTVNLLTDKNKQMLSFFKISPAGEEDGNPKNTTISKMQQNNILLSKYLSNVDDSLIDIANYTVAADQCKICIRGELIPYEDEGIVICNKCSHTFPYLVENEKPSYKETPKDVSFYAYKRVNHFKEVLAQFQAKETTHIDDEIILKIDNQITRERIQRKNLTNETMRAILCKLGYDSKYYEHVPFIKHKLGIKPIIMSRELEDELYNDFNDLQMPYFRHCPENRENFLNYNYTAFKLCERRGHYHFLKHFNKIKDPHKLIEHDNIWEKICADLHWAFIPTDYDAYDDM
jgi:hypothetical protein